MITERARKFYRLLKGKVQELNSKGLDFKLQPSLAKDGKIKIHLEGKKTVDFLIEVPKSPTDPLVLIKDDGRFSYLAEDLISEMIFAVDQDCYLQKYLPNMNPAVIPT